MLESELLDKEVGQRKEQCESEKLRPSTYGFEMRGLTYEAELNC